MFQLLGNIIVEAPRWILFEDSPNIATRVTANNNCRVTWIPSHSDSTNSNIDSIIYSAEVSFICPNMLSNVLSNEPSTKPLPQLLSFFVDKLKK